MAELMELSTLSQSKTDVAELEAKLSEARKEEKAIASLTVLQNRCHGKGKLPSRLCADILPYRYTSGATANLSKERLSVQKFTQLARYLTRTQIEAIAAHDQTFLRALSELPEQEDFHPSWFEHFLKWKITSHNLAIQFLQEVSGAIQEQERQYLESLDPAIGVSDNLPKQKKQRLDITAPQLDFPEAELSSTVDLGSRNIGQNQHQSSARGVDIHLDTYQSWMPSRLDAFDSHPSSLGHLNTDTPSSKQMASVGDIYTLTRSDVQMVVEHGQICGPIQMIDTYEKEAPSLVSFYVSEMASNHFILKYSMEN